MSKEFRERIERLRSSISGIEADIKGKERGRIPKHIDREELEKLTIRDKNGHYVKFELNKSQVKILKEINQALAAEIPVREILLKARRFGGSTLYCAISYILIRDYGYKITVVGHSVPAAKTLYRIIKLFYKKDITFNEKPEAQNTRELIFTDGGEVWVASADTEDAATSQTNQVVLATEVPRWPRAEEQMLSLLNTVSEFPGTFVFIESTAKGVGNYFHNTWLGAKAEKNEYVPIFVGWGEDEDNQRPFKTPYDRAAFIETYDEEEQVLADEGYTPEQLQWRRWHIANKCSGDIDRFHQDFPSNPSEAFLESGGPVFNQKRLAQWYEEASEFHPPIFEGEVNYLAEVDWKDVGYDEVARAKAFRKQPGGQLRVWEWPQARDEYKRVVNYGIGMDIAEGKERKDGEGDESTIFIGKQTWSEDRNILEEVKIVATWCGRMPPDDLGILGGKLGATYNNASICPEANSMGNTTIKVLWERYPKHRLYRRRGMKHIFDEKTRDSVGFYSDLKSKPTAIMQLAAFIRKNLLVLYDLDTIKELTEIINEKGRINTNGRDRTTATILCVESCVRDLKNVREEKEKTVYEINTKWKKQIRGEAEMDRRCYAALTGR